MLPSHFPHWRTDLIGLGLCAVLLAAFLIDLRPVLQSRENAQHARGELSAAVSRAESTKRALAAAQTQLVQEKKSADAERLALQPASRLNERLAKVNTLASQYGLRVDGVEPGLPGTGRFVAIPVHLTGQGNYRAATLFLNQLRKSMPDIGVDSLTLNAKENTTADFTLNLIVNALPG